MRKRCALCGTFLIDNRIWACNCGGRLGEEMDRPLVHVLAEPPLPSSAGVMISPRMTEDLDRIAANVTRLRHEFASAHRDVLAQQRRAEFRVIQGGRS